MGKASLRLASAMFFGFLALNSALGQDPARFQSEIDQYKTDTVNYSAVKNLVLFTGSSTVRMWADLKKDFPDRFVLNRGFGGSHMSDLLYYADTLILQYRPRMIFIYEGDNDLDSGKTPDEILASARLLVEKIRGRLPGSAICFISAKPSIARWNLRESFCSFNRRLEAFTRAYPSVFYIDTWNHMIASDGKPETDLFLEDGLHMNRKGYDIWKVVLNDFLIKHSIN